MGWLKAAEPKVVRKSKLGQAIAYSLSNWELLTNFLKDGQCELSNNRAERAIKPFVIGKKNYLKINLNVFGIKAGGRGFSSTLCSIISELDSMDNCYWTW